MVTKVFQKSIPAILLATLLIMVSCNNNGKNNNKSNSLSSSSINTTQNPDTIVYQSVNLVMRRISPHVFRHISFLNTHDFGRVECNGMVVVNGGKAVIFDTPANDFASIELINFVNKNLNSIITAVIPTHFHADCVGGLKAFGENHVPAFASNETIAILKNKGDKNVSLLKGFNDSLTLDISGEKVYSQFLGEGHTRDNIVGYFPADSILFGGCLIKELGAGKGNLEDANVKAWPSTVSKVKQKFPNAKIVIPGHGKPGGTDLLDYTIHLFR